MEDSGSDLDRRKSEGVRRASGTAAMTDRSPCYTLGAGPLAHTRCRICSADLVLTLRSGPVSDLVDREPGLMPNTKSMGLIWVS